MRETAELTAQASHLTGQGLRLALGALIGCPHQKVREAVRAALREGEAARGAAGEQRPQPDRSHVLWRRAVNSDGPWEYRISGSHDGLSEAARRWRGIAAPDGVTADYLVLPASEQPPAGQAEDACRIAGAA
jgi:hypothetical protein